MKISKIKRLLSKRNKGGFTLVEVIVSCALLGILVVAITMFVSPIMETIRVNEKNGRATMLAETLDNYIAGCLRDAAEVEVFVNTSIERAKNSGTTTVAADQGLKTAASNTEGLYKIEKFLQDNGGTTKYAVHCIGIRWVEDKTTGNKKLMVTNETVNNSPTGTNYSLNITSTTENKVFDDVMYNGLFPVVSVENFSKTKDTNGNYTPPYSKGYKITTKVYVEHSCYNTAETVRNGASPAFEGVFFASCDKLKDNISNVITLNDVQSTINANAATRQYTVGSNNYYYPDTYIYYVVRK